MLSVIQPQNQFIWQDNLLYSTQLFGRYSINRVF